MPGEAPENFAEQFYGYGYGGASECESKLLRCEWGGAQDCSTKIYKRYLNYQNNKHYQNKCCILSYTAKKI